MFTYVFNDFNNNSLFEFHDSEKILVDKKKNTYQTIYQGVKTLIDIEGFWIESSNPYTIPAGTVFKNTEIILIESEGKFPYLLFNYKEPVELFEIKIER